MNGEIIIVHIISSVVVKAPVDRLIRTKLIFYTTTGYSLINMMTATSFIINQNKIKDTLH